MTNAIYDFPLGWALTPHLGAGVGAVVLHDSVNIKQGQTTGTCAIGGCSFASNTDVQDSPRKSVETTASSV